MIEAYCVRDAAGVVHRYQQSNNGKTMRYGYLCGAHQLHGLGDATLAPVTCIQCLGRQGAWNYPAMAVINTDVSKLEF